MNEWNIQSRAHLCQACETKFSDQQPYHTLLFDEQGQYRRMDVCDPCWKSQFQQQSAQAISQWQGLYQAPPPAPPDPIQKDTAETLLRKLIERNDPHFSAAGYILAVMLERKRLLKVKEQFKREGQRVFIYEHPKSGDLFTIMDPDLQLNQLDAVQKTVAELLEHGLPGSEPEPGPAASEAEVPPTETPENSVPVQTPVAES